MRMSNQNEKLKVIEELETAKQLRFLKATKKLFRTLDFFNKGFIG